jgi:hypothetical protein
MTAKEFDNTITIKRAELLEKFKNKEDVTELDVYVKTIMDYQEAMIKTLLKEINSLKGDILSDNRERFKLIMDRLTELEK